MSFLDNLTNVAFASPKPVDKIVRVFTGTYNAATDLTARVGTIDTAYVYKIAHGLTRPVTCEIITSTNGGSTYVDGGANNGKIAFSDNTYVYILNSLSAPGVDSVVYKVYCSWIDDYDTTNPAIEAVQYTTVPTQFDSRLNYQKISDQNVLNFSAGTFGSIETKTVLHPLGYAPNAKVFFEAFPNEVWPLNASSQFQYDFAQDECTLSIYSDRIDINMFRFSNAAKRAWYKVYYDAN